MRTTIGWEKQGFTDPHGRVFRGVMWYPVAVDLPADSGGQRERHGSAQCSYEEQRDYREGDDQTQHASAAVLVLNHANEAQDKPERGPQE